MRVKATYNTTIGMMSLTPYTSAKRKTSILTRLRHLRYLMYNSPDTDLVKVAVVVQIIDSMILDINSYNLSLNTNAVYWLNVVYRLYKK